MPGTDNRRKFCKISCSMQKKKFIHFHNFCCGISMSSLNFDSFITIDYFDYSRMNIRDFFYFALEVIN